MCRNGRGIVCRELLEREVHWMREAPNTEWRSTVCCRDRESVKDGDERARRCAAVWFKADLVSFFMSRLSQGASSTSRRLVRAFPRALLHFHRRAPLRRELRDGTPLLCIRWTRNMLRVLSKTLVT